MFSRITSTLTVGDWQDAQRLGRGPFHVIVTCATDSPFVGDYHFRLVDGPATDNEKVFREAVALVGWQEEHGNRTFVHCLSGISRSVAVVAAHLMESRHVDYANAIGEIRKVRPMANPEPWFVSLLSGTRYDPSTDY